VRAHERPTFPYDWDYPEHSVLIENHHSHRGIPDPTDDNLLIATWNLTNFGLQRRHVVHLKLMADIIRPFDLVAVQEVADNLEHFDRLIRELGTTWDAIFTDPAGNQERLAYLYNTDRVSPTGLAAELAMRPYERQRVVVEDIVEIFEGFNRNPYMASFMANDFAFTLVNVHLYWTSFGLRQLEAKALSKWAKRRVGKRYPPCDDIILLGDFNMPRVRPTDRIYNELVANGLAVPKYATQLIGSNLAGDRDYDEFAFFPSRTNEDFTNRMGVFDFDKVVFPDLYQQSVDRFRTYVKYYLADHRPVWAEFRRAPNGD